MEEKQDICTKLSMPNSNDKKVETTSHAKDQTLNQLDEKFEASDEVIVSKAISIVNETNNIVKEKSTNEVPKILELPEGKNQENFDLIEYGPELKNTDVGSIADSMKVAPTNFVMQGTALGNDRTKESLNGAKSKEHSEAMLLGRRKSGRFWKGERDRFRSVIKTKGLKQACAQKRIAQKEQYLRVKEYEKSLKEESKRIKEEHRQRREENKKKKIENEKKNEVVQIIKNTAKIKRMKKKQLRMLAKRDVAIIQR